MNRGYIKLFRKIEDNVVFGNEPKCRFGAWVDLLLMVNHKDNSFMLGLQKMNIRRGQTWTSIDKLCKRWSWGRDRVSRYLNLLENEGMIYQERTNRGLLITVVNYGYFQDFKVDTRQPTRQPIEQPIRHQANIKTDSKPDSQSHINNNDKNDNKNDVNNENKNEKKPAAHSDFCGGVVYEE